MSNVRRLMNQSLAGLVLVSIAGCTNAPTVVNPSQTPAGPKTLPSVAAATTYAERVAMRIKPNIMLAEPVPEDATAEVEIRTNPEGKIVAYRLSRKSASLAWDTAVLRAIERTAVLPLDTTGTIPTVMTIVFSSR
jgi:colicin import membrane protein